MSLWKIAWRSIQQRALASGLTGLSMALGVALVAAVLVIHGVVERSFRRGAQGYELIVGPKGSPLQLVLNTVYHMSEPVGKLPYETYTQLADEQLRLPDGSRAERFAHVIPMCMGGNYRGFRVVGTTPEFFELEYHEGEFYEFTQHGGQGRNMSWSEDYEAVIGSTVARSAGLRVGDTFRPVHGLDPGGEEHDSFTVVGIFAPTGTPNDHALFINIEGFFLMHEHKQEADAKEAHEGADHGDATEGTAQETHEEGHEQGRPPAHAPQEHGPLATAAHAHGADAPPSVPVAAEKTNTEKTAAGHDDHDDHGPHARQVSAVLISLEGMDPGEAMAVPAVLNNVPGIQAVQPAREIDKLLAGIVGNVQWVLLVLAILVVVVAGIGILVSIYNSMNDRRHDIAVMRALGASRLTVMLVILMESILLSLGGGAAGLLLAHGLIGLLGPLIAEHTGVAVGALQFQASELILIPGLVLLASLVGYLPAVTAYRTDVAKSLASTP